MSVSSRAQNYVRVRLGTRLSFQTSVLWGGKITSRGNPVELDVGCCEPGEGAENESGLHDLDIW